MRAELSRLPGLARRLARHRPRTVSAPDHIQAAVALIFASDPDALLLIRRAERADDPWSGQMGLPGGRQDPGDPDLMATAVRETREEIGLKLGPSTLLGVWNDLVPTTPLLPRIRVRPFVFGIERAPLRLSDEVAEAEWVPLDALLAPGVYGEYEVEGRGLRFTRPGYRLPQGVVWGMTERILTPLLALLTGPDPTG